jgi:predicted enzyme related to lactoylglutathione lyase
MPHGDYNHIEIPADDTKRARAFYEGLFGSTFTDTQFGDYALYATASGEQGVSGGLGKRGETAPMSTRNYVSVDSIEAALARAVELGGRVIENKDEVPGVGWWAVIADTEGNELGIFESMPR